MVREFKLMNEKNEEFSLMDINNYCLLTEPSGLGYQYNSSYEQVGNTFIEDIRRVAQGKVNGIANFKNYDNYNKLVNFIEQSEKLRIAYKIPFNNETKTFFRTVNIADISKTQKQENGIISESITFDCLDLWYQDKETEYAVGEEDIQWNFRWDTRFSEFKERSIFFENDGHVEAPIKVELNGYLIRPRITVLVNGEILFDLPFDIILENNEKLLYSSEDNNLYIKWIHADGTEENLFKQQYIDLNNTNIFKIPKGTTEIRLTAENDIVDAKLNVYNQYKVV